MTWDCRLLLSLGPRAQRHGREGSRHRGAQRTSPGNRSASACCSLAAAWGTQVRPDAGLVSQLLPGIPRRSADRVSRAPTPRPPAGLRVRWLEERRRRGHSPLPAGAATSPPGRAPRSPAAVRPGAGRTAPPGEHPAGGDIQGSAPALHLGHCIIRELQTRDVEPDSCKGLGANPSEENIPSPNCLLS